MDNQPDRKPDRERRLLIGAGLVGAGLLGYAALRRRPVPARAAAPVARTEVPVAAPVARTEIPVAAPVPVARVEAPVAPRPKLTLRRPTPLPPRPAPVAPPAPAPVSPTRQKALKQREAFRQAREAASLVPPADPAPKTKRRISGKKDPALAHKSVSRDLHNAIVEIANQHLPVGQQIGRRSAANPRAVGGTTAAEIDKLVSEIRVTKAQRRQLIVDEVKRRKKARTELAIKLMGSAYREFATPRTLPVLRAADGVARHAVPFPTVAKRTGVDARGAKLQLVDVSKLRATQASVTGRGVSQYLRGARAEAPLVAKTAAGYAILDGHHRATASKLRGAKRIWARVAR